MNTNSLLNKFTDAFQPTFNGNLWEWCQQNLVLPQGAYSITGPFNVDISPYLKQPMEDFTNPNIRQINIASAVQTGKSLIQEVLAPYVLLQDPSPTLRLFPTDTMASVAMNTRLLPILKSNSTSNLMNLAKFNAKTGLLNLGNQFIKACGTAENNLHSLSIKYAILDEVWLYQDPTILDKVKARLSAFENRYKLILTSQPDTEHSLLHKEYNKGTVYEWGWKCPSCDMLQPYEFSGNKDGKYYGLVWNPCKELTHDQRTDNTKMVCQHCFHAIQDTEDNRIKLVADGAYIKIKDGDRTINSYSWPAYVNKDLTFKKMAMQYLQAKTIFKNTSISEDLKVFRNQRLAKFWQVGEQIDAPKLLQDGVNTNEIWLDETHRFMTVDVQKDHMFWVVTAWSNKVSEARLIDWGVCVGYDELNNIRNRFKIKTFCVAIDSGDDTSAIYKECVLRGERVVLKNGKNMWATWIALKGDGGRLSTPKVNYKHADGSLRYYGMESQPDPQWPANSRFKGLRAKLYLWSNYSVKMLLKNILNGKAPFKIVWGPRADETFTNHMHSEELNIKSGRFEPVTPDRPNHLWDCMCMAVVMALMAKCYVPEATLSEQAAVETIKQQASLQT